MVSPSDIPFDDLVIEPVVYNPGRFGANSLIECINTSHEQAGSLFRVVYGASGFADLSSRAHTEELGKNS